MKVFKNLLINGALETAFNNMVPQMIPVVVFFTFIAIGNTLDLAVSLIALSYFDRLIQTISQLPDLVNKFNEQNISFSRI